MASTSKVIVRTFKLLFVFYVLICAAIYFFQEKLIFFPDKLDRDYSYSFDEPFQELNIKCHNGNIINALLFTSDSSKGLIFFLHGNAGSLDKWGKVAKRYTDLHYDVFIPDYPGYGKSMGSIHSKTQLFEDIQQVYDEVKKRYSEKTIVVLGYSIGTGPASYLASTNHPRLLILQAPYYSLTDMMHHYYPILPSFLLKYKFDTYQYLKGCTMPVVIFHGNKDEVIYYNSSVKLQKEFKPGDTLITLDGQGHNGITDNVDYLHAIQSVLK